MTNGWYSNCEKVSHFIIFVSHLDLNNNLHMKLMSSRVDRFVSGMNKKMKTNANMQSPAKTPKSTLGTGSSCGTSKVSNPAPIKFQNTLES